MDRTDKPIFKMKDSLPCYNCGKEAHIFEHYGTDYNYDPETKTRVKKEIWIALCSKCFKESQLLNKIGRLHLRV